MSSYQIWRYTSRPADKKGFTLVEIAIVLVIVGLIIGTLAPLMMSMIKRDKLKSGRQTVQRARDEIIGYAMINRGRLPALTNLAHRKDPWGNQLYLIPAPSLDPSLATSTDVCSVNATTTPMMSVILYGASGGGSCSTGNIVSNVACIVASKGPDYNRQISTISGGQVGILDYGCSGDLYPADNSGVPSNRPFDDIYEYMSLEELKARVCQPSSNSTSP